MSEEESDALTIAYISGFHRRNDEVMELRQAKDKAYSERDLCIVGLAKLALKLGYTAGLGQHVDKPGEEWEGDWRHIVFIDLPTGQISFHIHDSEVAYFDFLPEYEGTWDGHTVDEKYNRLLDL